MWYEEYVRRKYKPTIIERYGPFLKREMGGCASYEGWELICDNCPELNHFLENHGVKIYTSRRDFGKPRIAFMGVEPESVIECAIEKICQNCENLESLKSK